MSRSALDTRTDFSLLQEFSVPCSGTAHRPGMEHDSKLHGDDVEAAAEWYVRWRCGYCDYTGLRPVCDFFANVCRTNKERVVACGQCKKMNFHNDYFVVIARL